MPEKEGESDPHFEQLWAPIDKRLAEDAEKAVTGVPADSEKAGKAPVREKMPSCRTAKSVKSILRSIGPDLPEPPQAQDDASGTDVEDGTITLEALEDAEGVSIMTEEITSFNFNRITVIPKSAITANILAKTLPQFCESENLLWSRQGDAFIIEKREDAAYEDRTMAPENSDFARKLVGYFSRETQVD